MDRYRESHLVRLTEIFDTDAAPPVGSILIAIEEVASTTEPTRICVTGLARVHNKQKVATGKSRSMLYPVHGMPADELDPYFKSISSRFSNKYHNIGLPTSLVPIRIVPTVAKEVLVALGDRHQLPEWLQAEEQAGSSTPPQFIQQARESQDAIALAFEFADLKIPGVSPQGSDEKTFDPSDPVASVLANAHLADSEEDLLPVDLRRFTEEASVEEVSGHVARIREGSFELIVFNVNKKPLEVSLGVDLVYWDTIENAFTLVQYKRLDKDRDNNWSYKKEKDISKQLEQMVSLPQPHPLPSADWRLSSPYWFKFVHRDAALNPNRKLLQGMYVPADYLRVAIADKSLFTGPKQGFQVTYSNVKYIPASTFTELVRRGLIGTAGQQSVDMAGVIGNLTASGRSAIVAMKARWQEKAASPNPMPQEIWDSLERAQNGNRAETEPDRLDDASEGDSEFPF